MDTADYTRYIVVGLPRTGTTAVHLALRGHPNVAAFSDEVHVKPLFSLGVGTFSFGSEFEEERRLGYRFLFDALASISKDSDTTHLGVKVCAQTVDQARILAENLPRFLPDAKVVLTVRSDLTAVYGSSRNARKTQQWHSWNSASNGERARNRPRKLNRVLFTRYALRSLECMSVLRRMRETMTVYEFDFQRMLESPANWWCTVFDFLGLPQVDVTWVEAKKVMPPPEQYIDNYRILRRIERRLTEQVNNDAVPSWLKRGVRMVDGIAAKYHGCDPGEDRRVLI